MNTEEICRIVLDAMSVHDVAIEHKSEDYKAGFDDAHALLWNRVKDALTHMKGS